jgi:hypothetical protein
MSERRALGSLSNNVRCNTELKPAERAFIQGARLVVLVALKLKKLSFLGLVFIEFGLPLRNTAVLFAYLYTIRFLLLALTCIAGLYIYAMHFFHLFCSLVYLYIPPHSYCFRCTTKLYTNLDKLDHHPSAGASCPVYSPSCSFLLI